MYWYVAILIDYDAMSLPHNSASDVVIEGQKRFATLSDGTAYNPFNRFKGKTEKLAKLKES